MVYYLIPVLGLLVGLVIFLVLRKKKAPTYILTAKGAKVIGNVGSPALYEIDRQLDALFTKAVINGYSGFSRHSSYVIEILPADSRCTAPAFVVNAPNYDGTDYDIDPRPGFGVICAAGRFIPETGRIQVTETGILTTDIVRYEGEHKLLFEVDRSRYEATKTHSSGTGHPIF